MQFIVPAIHRVQYIISVLKTILRMTYLPGEASAKTGHREAGHVEYQSKDGTQTKMFDAMEWFTAMPGAAKPYEDCCSHVPNKGEQMVRYYGYYSNLARGKRKKAGADDKISCILEPELTDKAFRKN